MQEVPSTESGLDIQGRAAVITGGGGALCSVMAKALADNGADIAILDIELGGAELVARAIDERGGRAVAVQCDVTKPDSLLAASSQVMDAFGAVDILINGAGGNNPGATTSPDRTLFELDSNMVSKVFDLNFMGTFLTCQEFGKIMAEQESGVIINIASMNAFRPLTHIAAYSAAKAAVANFTQWLAVHMAQEYSPSIRVNAIAPGFFLTQQNRFLLIDEETGELTPRGRQIIDQTPMGRFGTPSDLVGTVRWLLAESASFVTGIIVPVDGGYSAYGGV
ncbi:MAG: SDR family oxidoreductase [Anaerolineales bacterium]|nr:SDR family oxidoreductase [Anaerolineales bacterium]